MNIKTTFLLNRPGLFEVDVTYKPNTDPSTPDTAPWGGRGLHFPRCFPFKLAAAPLPGRTLLPAASQGTGTKTISSARSGDRAAASQTPALPWPGQAPRVWAGGVTAQRAHPGRRRGGAVKSAISVKGSESRGACRRKPAPGLLPRGGGDVSCHYASGSAAALLSQFCPNFVFFLIVMIGKSVPLTACEATACCCGFALPLGRVIGAACPGGQEKVPLDSRKEKHEHSHNVCVRSPAANSGFAGKSVKGGGGLHFCLRVQQRPGASALGGWSPSPPGPSRGEGHGDRQGRPRGASAALRTCPCDEHGKISYDVVAEI